MAWDVSSVFSNIHVKVDFLVTKHAPNMPKSMVQLAIYLHIYVKKYCEPIFIKILGFNFPHNKCTYKL